VSNKTDLDRLIYGVRLSEVLSLTDMFMPQMIYEFGELRWNDIDRGSQRTQRKTCPSATLSTINPIWIDPSANPGLRGERPVTNGLSHGTALARIELGPKLCTYKCKRRLTNQNL
jgi:hypothetical protein